MVRGESVCVTGRHNRRQLARHQLQMGVGELGRLDASEHARKLFFHQQELLSEVPEKGMRNVHLFNKMVSGNLRHVRACVGEKGIPQWFREKVKKEWWFELFFVYSLPMNEQC